MQYNFHQYKLIPQNYLAEETLLGIIIIYPEIIKTIQNIIPESIFFVELNKVIYQQIVHASDQKKISISSLFNQLEHEHILNNVGGVKRIQYLMKQGQIFIFSYQINNYIENLISLLKINYVRRIIIQLGYNMIKIGYIDKLDIEYVYKKVISYVENIERNIIKNSNDNIIDIKELISTKLLSQKYNEIMINVKSNFKKLKSGFEQLDEIIQDLSKGNLIVIAGRPSIGKTSFAINIAHHCFFTNSVNLIIFSLEMSTEQIFNKFISISSRTKMTRTSTNNIYEKSWTKISTICHKLLKQNIYINEKANLNIAQIEFIANKLKKKNNIELILIDYLQLIEISSKQKIISNRSQEIGYITRRLKLLAQHLDIPVITISQLNRNIESRSDKAPVLSDLKESGCINYFSNLNTKSDYLEQTNIKYKRQIQHTKCGNNLKIFQKYIFSYLHNKKYLGLTNNHILLNNNFWIKLNQIISMNTISKLERKMKEVIQKEYTNYISFLHYLKIYDLNNQKYFNFISENIILHNSIEQDADVIIILYKIENKEYTQENQETKIIDLKISKNRNGGIGDLKLYFETITNTFRDIKEI
uniref:DNA 5'-3' helicase n=1 Tax=Polysiphonia sertularioides TaxID=945028 RepID=A0A1Z1M8Z4_9FLOR|nr:Replication helicase subunit [Polysiphonia sertularioides]ARW62567.1 Replication helicase subunit [Polysiphonia sertularioides]